MGCGHSLVGDHQRHQPLGKWGENERVAGFFFASQGNECFFLTNRQCAKVGLWFCVASMESL